MICLLFVFTYYDYYKVESVLAHEEAAIRKRQASEKVVGNILAIDIYGFTTLITISDPTTSNP